ncbi:MAG: hypothetical protein J6V83_03625, partial [Clostridia bacterium]|nr:hypothetical protein [Clostridia bacterium]
MKLIIDKIEYTAKPDQSLYDIVKELGFIKGNLSTDPIAAKMAGRVFTLNYVPLREKDLTPERKSVRKAVASANGIVTLLTIKDEAGRDVYMRTAQFIIFLAIERLWPQAQAKMCCTIGSGVYVKVHNAEGFDVQKLKAEIQKIVDEDIVLRRSTITTAEAIAYYKSQGLDDKARLLEYRNKETFNIYKEGDFADYYYGEMAPRT